MFASWASWISRADCCWVEPALVAGTEDFVGESETVKGAVFFFEVLVLEAMVNDWLRSVVGRSF